MSLEKDNTSKQIKRDLKLSVLTGPFTFIVPIFSYLLLYPIILSRSSIDVLGIWSLYVTTASFFTVADLGFSQHFIRESGKDRSQQLLAELKGDLNSAKRFYLFVGSVGLLIITFLFKSIFSPAENVYSSGGLFISAILLVIGTTLQLISTLDAAILSARADNYFVRLVKSVSPLFTYSFAIVGALFKFPIEGFVTGFLFANSFLIIVYRNRQKHNHAEWYSIEVSTTISQTIPNLRRLIKEGWQLYVVSVGMIIRQPVVRYVIAIGLGLPAVGVFDIAMRITTTSRDVIASGFTTLYPSFSYFFRNRLRDKIIDIIRITLMLLIPIGIITVVVLIYYSDFILKIWLNDVPVGTVSATQILAIWQFMTLLNIPFWHLLLASHNERVAAIAVWVHTISILILLPLKLLNIEFSLLQLLLYWTIAAGLTQIMIYVFVEYKLKLLLSVFRDKKFSIILSSSAVYLLIVILTENILGIDPKVSAFINAAATIIFVLVLLPFYIPLIKQNLNFTKF